MPSHPPVPNLVKPNPPPTPPPAHPLLERQEESSLPTLGDSQFDLVLDPNVVAMVDDPVDLDPHPARRPDTEDELVALADEPELDALSGYHRRRAGLWVGLNVLGLGLVGYAGYRYVEDLRDQVVHLGDEKAEATRRLEETEQQRAQLEAQRQALEQRQGELTATLAAKEAELTVQKAALDAEAQKLAWIPDARVALETTLEVERKKGDAIVRVEGPRLVVELSERALFAGPEEVLHDGGAALLSRLGPVLAGIPDRTIEVHGHADLAPPAPILAKHGTTYVWAAARAQTVLTALSGAGKVPAQRLAVVSWAEHRPKYTQKNATARKKNRRVELVLGP